MCTTRFTGSSGTVWASYSQCRCFWPHSALFSPPTTRVRDLSMSINGRRRFRSHKSTPPACTHCAPLSQTVRAAVSNGNFIPHSSVTLQLYTAWLSESSVMHSNRGDTTCCFIHWWIPLVHLAATFIWLKILNVTYFTKKCQTFNSTIHDKITSYCQINAKLTPKINATAKIENLMQNSKNGAKLLNKFFFTSKFL